MHFDNSTKAARYRLHWVVEKSTSGFGRPQYAFGLVLFFLAATSAIAANSALVFLSVPTGEVRQDTTLRLSVASRNSGDTLKAGCALFAGQAPAGSSIAGHPNRLPRVTDTEGPNRTRILTFRPIDLDTSLPGSPSQLSLGIHYLVAACPDTGSKVTPEIPIRVVTTQPPNILTPRATETNPRPDISWTAVPGVPAYHLLLSDQALQIDPQGGGVSGASVIWQAIVTGTRITYGTPDPSGNFSQVPAPPLSPGVPYNLVVLNNYDGRSAVATSTRSQGLRLFTLTAKGNPPGKPTLVAPAAGSKFAAPKDSLIVFRWTPSQGGDEVNVYRLYVYAAENQQGSTVLLPVWQGEYTDTSAVLDARRTLLTQRYVAKVFAVTAAGLTAISDTVSFAYTNKVQTLSVAAKGPNGAGDTVMLDNVRVTVTPVTGSGQPFPLYTVGNQRVEKILASGSYLLDFAKEGYLSDRRTVNLNGQGIVQVTGILSLASCQIQARVVGNEGQPIDNALARLTSESGEAFDSRSDAGGRVIAGVKPGRYRLSLSRDDYTPRPDTLLDLAARQTLNLGTLVLNRATGLLTGTVASASGNLPGAKITVSDENGNALRSLLSDGNGRFQALMPPGAYVVTAAFAGMVGGQQSITLKQSSELRFLLQAGASIVRGRVRLRVSGSSDPPSPVKGAKVRLGHAETSNFQATLTDVNGEFSFSTAETGEFYLAASLEDQADPDSVAFALGDERATVERDLTLRALLNLQGSVQLNPDTALDPSALSIALIDYSLDKVVRGGRAFRDSSGLRFLVENVADGHYRLSASGGGYATEIEPEFFVEEGVATPKPSLSLGKNSGALIFTLRGGDSALPGRIRIYSPITAGLRSGDTLKPAGFGTYQLSAAPDDSDRIPLIRMSQIVEKNGNKPVEITVTCPFSHRQAPEKQKDGRYVFLLQEDLGLDSGYLILEAQNGLRQTLSLRGDDVRFNAGVLQIPARLPAGATRLSYWFVIYQGGSTYADEDPSLRHTLDLFKPGELAEIRLDVSDSIRLPEKSRSVITLSAFDSRGRSLDSVLAARGALRWKHTGGQAFTLRQPNAKSLQFTLESGLAATLGNEDDGESRASARRARALGEEAWDTLSLIASLDGLERGMIVAARIDQAQINFVSVATSLGDVEQIESPRSLTLRLLAFDTTYSPPLPLSPNPSFVLDPPESGVLRGVELALDSDFIGPLRIRGRHAFPDGKILEAELRPGVDALSRGLNVGQTVTPGAKGRLLRHGTQLILFVPDSLVGGEAATVLRAYRRAMPKTFTSLKEAAVAGDVWEITNPSATPLRSRMTLGLTVPNSLRHRSNALRRFDAIALDWLPLDTLATEFDGRLRPIARAQVKGLDGNYWAILSASGELEASDLRVTPNPFSPRVTALRDGNTKPGTRIRFRPDSRESPEVTITLAVYTLEGERVRLIADHQTHPKSVIEYYWDGLTDDGRVARNGRYLLALTLMPTGGGRSKQFLKPLVVFE